MHNPALVNLLLRDKGICCHAEGRPALLTHSRADPLHLPLILYLLALRGISTPTRW